MGLPSGSAIMALRQAGVSRVSWSTVAPASRGLLEGGVHVVDGQGHEHPGRVQADVGGGDGQGGCAGLELAPVVVLDARGGEAEHVAVEAGRRVHV